MERRSSISTAIPPEDETFETVEVHLNGEGNAQPDVAKKEPSKVRLDEDEDDTHECVKHTLPLYSTGLKRLTRLFWFYTLYSALAITSWVMTCVLTFRPLPKGTYVNVYNSAKPDFEDAKDFPLGTSEQSLRNLYDTSHRWYQAAQVMQAIVALFTLTLTSAICSKCVVVYLQNTKYRTTLRQALTLADKNWLNLRFYVDLPRGKKNRARSTTPLYIFMAVTFIGSNVTRSMDIANLRQGSGTFGSRISVTISKIFQSAQVQKIIPNLWIDQNTDLRCQDSHRRGQLSQQMVPQLKICNDGSVRQTYGDAPTMNPPFLTHLPAFKNTGLIKQFALRMNSSVRYFGVDSLPLGCNKEDSDFYVEYELNSAFYKHTHAQLNYSVRACSLSIIRAWNDTRDRQDIEENFYLQIRNGHNSVIGYSHEAKVFQAQANTSLGWFQLPNYANNNTAGPLLDRDPFPCHSDSCAAQTWNQVRRKRERGDNKIIGESPGSTDLSMRTNLGPLTLTMLALFSGESWFSLQTDMALQGFVWPRASGPPICADTAPLSMLDDHIEPFYFYLTCISNDFSSHSNAGWIPATWLDRFFMTERFQAILGAAVLLASDVWLSNPFGLIESDLLLFVFSDMGMDTIVPSMSSASIIVISALWGIYLTFLLALIYYAVSTKVWTHSIDAFTLVKVGSVLHEKIALLPSQNEHEVQAWDEIPGWFGDQVPSDKLGRVGLGAEHPLRSGRRYVAYPKRPKRSSEKT